MNTTTQRSMRLRWLVMVVIVMMAMMTAGCGGTSSTGEEDTKDTTKEAATDSTDDSKPADDTASEDTAAKEKDDSQEPADKTAVQPNYDKVVLGTQMQGNTILNYGDAGDGGSMFAIHHVFSQLVQLTKDGASLSIASKIEPNKDATEWTFELKEAVYHDGSPVTATDALKTMEALANSRTMGSFYAVVDFEKSSVADDKTFTVVLKEPHADFVEGYLIMGSPIYPGGDLTSTIGSGPYKYVSGDSSTGYKLAANDNWYGGTPPIKEIEVRNIDTPNARANALIAGEIDFATDLDIAAQKAVEKADGVLLTDTGISNANLLSIEMNTNKPPFNDPEIRKAMKMVFDRKQMVDVVMGDLGELGNDMLSMGYYDYNTDVKQRETDVEAAKKIFADKNFTELELTVVPMVDGMSQSAEIIKQQLEAAGVTVNLVSADPAAFWSDPEAIGKTEAFTFYWINRSLAATIPMAIGKAAGFNVSGYTSEALEEQLTINRESQDDAERVAARKKIGEILWEDGGQVIWGYKKVAAGVSDTLPPYYLSNGMPIFDGIRD